MTGIPVAVKSWTAGLLVNQRITFSSLILTLGTYITGITNQVIARGYTCSGSSNGTTGAMDGVNRCTSAAGFATRATIAGAAQSWIIIKAANNVQTLITFQGASDDIARISFSPGNLFVVAGTPVNQPTAADELVYCSTASLIGATASGDRLFNVWVDSTNNMWRAAIFRAGILVAPLIGTELFDTSPLVGVTCNPPVYGFAQTIPNGYAALIGGYAANATGGLCKTSGNATTQLGGAGLVTANNVSGLDGVSLSANGSLFAIRSLGLSSISTGCIGLVGNKIDWYASADFQACGALTAGLTWVFINAANAATASGILLPWDTVTTSCITS